VHIAQAAVQCSGLAAAESAVLVVLRIETVVHAVAAPVEVRVVAHALPGVA